MTKAVTPPALAITNTTPTATATLNALEGGGERGVPSSRMLTPSACLRRGSALRAIPRRADGPVARGTTGADRVPSVPSYTVLLARARELPHRTMRSEVRDGTVGGVPAVSGLRIRHRHGRR